ncbi:MAG: hypothetical protein GF308_06175 [Candidatus Heimdallarchaeota archaeon]|nr:hypothetical protein [Candidatus Heimdallarchaeota archaeon]
MRIKRDYFGGAENGSFAFDNENKRLFLCSNGLKVIDVSNPKKPKIIGRYPRDLQHMTYHNGHLFASEGAAQKFVILDVANEKDVRIIWETWEFILIDLREIHFLEGGTIMAASGRSLSFWDIKDISNPELLGEYSYKLLEKKPSSKFYPLSIGLAFHPEKKKLLVGFKRLLNSKVKFKAALFDYSNCSDLKAKSFAGKKYQNEKSLLLDNFSRLLPNGIFPIISNHDHHEVIDWTNASKPIFYKKFRIKIDPDPEQTTIIPINGSQILVHGTTSYIMDFNKRKPLSKPTPAPNNINSNYFRNYPIMVDADGYIYKINNLSTNKRRPLSIWKIKKN